MPRFVAMPVPVLIPMFMPVAMFIPMFMPVAMFVFVAVLLVRGPAIMNVLAPLQPAAHAYLHPGSANAAFNGRKPCHGNLRKPQAVHGPKERLRILRQLQQRPHKHIPRRAHPAFQI
jgi:hypothetical protein